MTDDFIIRRPDGSTPTPEEIAKAMHDVSAAQEHEMSCPQADCSGKVEAHAPFWMTVSADGRPFLDGVGWVEGGVITCSHGGEEHIPADLTDRLDDTLMAYCSTAEAALGAAKGEDAIRNRWSAS